MSSTLQPAPGVFAHLLRAIAMSMKIVAAAVGAAAFQGLAGLFASPARAAWGWEMTVPADLGFSCSEGSTIGCAGFAGCTADNFTCTVVPDAGKACDVSSIDVTCSIPDGAQNFVPMSGDPKCAQMPGNHYNNASLAWNPVPSCMNATTPGATSTSDASLKVVGVTAAGLAVAQLL